MKTWMIALVSAAIGAGVATWMGQETRERGASGRTDAAAERREWKAREASLESEIRRKDQEVERLQARVASLAPEGDAKDAAPKTETKPGAEAVEKPQSDGKPRLVFRDYEKGLESIAWDKLGGATSKLMPLLGEGFAIATGTKKMRPEYYGELTSTLGPLVSEVMKGEAAGASWAHPSVQINLVYATLREAGAPLNEDQLADLERIGNRFIAEEARRSAGYSETTMALQKRIELVKELDRMYEAVRGILDARQTAVLYPEGVRGRVGLDLFSGSVQWDEHFEHVGHRGRADFEKRIVDRVVRDMELEEADRAVCTRVVADWARQVPDTYFEFETEEVVQADSAMESSTRVMEAATRQLALLNLLRAELTSTKAREQLLQGDFVVVPRRQK